MPLFHEDRRNLFVGVEQVEHSEKDEKEGNTFETLKDE